MQGVICGERLVIWIEDEIDEDGVWRRIINLQMFVKGKHESHVWSPTSMRVRGTSLWSVNFFQLNECKWHQFTICACFYFTTNYCIIFYWHNLKTRTQTWMKLIQRCLDFFLISVNKWYIKLTQTKSCVRTNYKIS